ncbi:hypothetical protein [Actinacidiphila sp. bgisy167]|uniref:hypothetical protein n=1 Tax=Actinacidiphila sp. bgisy167 TaxID=3413797 RepID=UPI003D736FB8
MRRFPPLAGLLSGLLLLAAVPAFTSGAAAAVPAKAAAATAGPGADGPDLSNANRIASPPDLPNWSRVGYRNGAPLPGDDEVNGDASCRITPEKLSSTYGVTADDGVDDTAGLQKAIDDIKSACSPSASYERLSLISLPAGRIDVSRQIYVDASFLIVRGQGSGDGGTKLVFRPDVDTRYDTLVNGRWDQDSMKAGSGSDVGTGGWMWPGRGMFRVQTRDIADRYKDDWAAAPANRKDIFEGSVNQHWASGIKLAAKTGDPGYSARRGSTTVQLISTATMSKFTPGGYVWVGAANSVKFYEQQGVTDKSVMDDLHMRQQMFRVTSVDADAKTIRLDRPLEWDLPVDSTSDGSEALGDKPYASKVTPLKIVEGVGFENFAFTQDMNGLPKLGGGTYQLTPDQAVHNYGNVAPEYAMHGIVYKWAANSWARGLKATMTGSHPIVTENALNLQIERNSFDGAWNKGKGGNGYLRGSRVWNSLWAYNLSRNLRHFTFQWSASGNVAFRNDTDSDLNLHGGWEHDNLFEQNTVRVPYEHRSASCETNCGGEGGEIDEGTWYPIWWAAGPKAVKWSGSSGPQNVFYNNTLIKQTTPGGSFEPYGPYSNGSSGSESGTVYEFGSNDDDPERFQPLSQGGQGIPDWTGRETLDYIGRGIATTDVGSQQSLFLRDTGGELDPRTLNERNVINWNMQGATYVNPDTGERHNNYEDVRDWLATGDASIVLLQEAGNPDAGSSRPFLRFQREIAQHVYQREDGSYPAIREYWVDSANSVGWLYWLHTDRTDPAGRVNVAIASRTRVAPDDLHVTEPGEWDPVLEEGYSRPALGVTVDGAAYFTVHARADNQGQDAPALLDQIRARMATRGPNGGPRPWLAAGDWNRDPYDLNPAITPPPGTPVNYRIYRVGNTHPAYGHGADPLTSALDYPVVGSFPNRLWIGERRLFDDVTTSDHVPVWFRVTNLPQQVTPPPLPGMPQVVVPQTNVQVRSVHTINVAGLPLPGSNVIGDVPFNYDNPELNLKFDLRKSSDYPGYYNLLAKDPKYYNYYLGQEGGRRDAKLVLWKEPELDQLWKPTYEGDGTWTLENYKTKQYLTAPQSGGQLFAQDEDPESPTQRWFLQDAKEAASVNEVVLGDKSGPSGQALSVDDLEEEPLPLFLNPDTDDSNQRFVTIPTPEGFVYLVWHGKYVTSTVSYEEPRDGANIATGPFRANDRGAQWFEERDSNGGELLSNQTGPDADDRAYLVPNANHTEVSLRSVLAGLLGDRWYIHPKGKP